jgi:hypothetical protein
MEDILNLIIIILLIYCIYLFIYKPKQPIVINKIQQMPIYPEINKTRENFNTDKIFINEKPNKVTFKLDDENKDLNKDFLNEQEHGVVMNTVYPNTWIEKIDDKGEPVYNSRKNVTKKEEINIDSLINPKTRFNNDFVGLKCTNMDGAADENRNQTIKDIYDNSFVDYKKLVEKKDSIDYDRMIQGASNLSSYNIDNWEYENEKATNGGELAKGLYASDYANLNNAAAFV